MCIPFAWNQDFFMHVNGNKNTGLSSKGVACFLLTLKGKIKSLQQLRRWAKSGKLIVDDTSLPQCFWWTLLPESRICCGHFTSNSFKDRLERKAREAENGIHTGCFSNISKVQSHSDSEEIFPLNITWISSFPSDYFRGWPPAHPKSRTGLLDLAGRFS